MTRKRKTVKELAQEAQLDTDEALILLWDAGYDEVLRPSDRVRDVNWARRALGLGTRREFRSVAYWMSILDLTEPEFQQLCEDLSVPVSRNAHKVKGKTIARLKSEARKRGIDFKTGSPAVPEEREPLTKSERLDWPTIGHERELRLLTEEEVLKIHNELVNDFAGSSDPIEPSGIRTEALLGSAVFRPQTNLGGTLKYPTVEMAGAALLHSIIGDHPFHNGNKRTALVSALVFLDENGFYPLFDKDEAFKLVLDLAQHRIVRASPPDQPDRETLEVAKWLHEHCRIMEKGNRPMQFRKLRRILSEYNCEFGDSSGGKIEITHNVSTKTSLRTFFKTKQAKTLRTQIVYGGEGREVSRQDVKRIRKDLHLDDDNGVDSRAFYSKGPVQTTYFIARYRKTLKRLAKF